MNPLIAKWEELKKPAPIDNKIQHELDPEFVEKLKDVDTLSTLSIIEDVNTLSTLSITGNTGTGITASNYHTATNSIITHKPKPVTTYDVDSCNDTYFQVANQIRNKNAIVTSMSMEQGTYCSKKITFEVALYD